MSHFKLNYKILLLIFFVLFSSNLVCFAAEKAVNSETQIKFEKQKVKIEKSLKKKKYSKALRLINKSQKKFPEINQKDKEFLDKNEQLCKNKINEIKFWQRYYVENDKIAKVVRYYPIINLGLMRPYIVKDNNSVSLYTRIYFSYQQRNWLFIKSATIYYDDNTLDFDLIDAGTDVNCYSTFANCTYYEYKLINWTKYAKILKDIGNSKTVIIRAHGQYHYMDFPLSRSNVKKLREMVELYDFFKTNKLPETDKILLKPDKNAV